MRVLVIDIGGTHIKAIATGRKDPVKIPSGPTLTPKDMVGLVRQAIGGWSFDAVSIGYPGPVVHGRAVSEPRNLGSGWVGYNFRRAFGCPVKEKGPIPDRPRRPVARWQLMIALTLSVPDEDWLVPWE